MIADTGSIALRMVADRTGLAKRLSAAMVRRSFVPVHDRGQVLTDVAVMLADGDEAISDINVLRHQPQVLRPVASAPTVWRTPQHGTHRGSASSVIDEANNAAPVPERSLRIKQFRT